MKVAWAIVAVAVLSWGQTTDRNATAPSTTKAAAPAARPDTWQRSKECAAQAEKIVAEWPQRTGTTPADWHNHYSPKYDNCFVTIYFSQLAKDEKTFPSIFSTVLFDAFERSAPIASACTLLRGNSDCAEQIAKIMRDGLSEGASKALNGKSFGEATAAEQEAVRKVVGDVGAGATWCSIDGQPVVCAKAASFILEHMKN
jgi:hypothetical protein